MSNYNSQLQENNTDLQSILNTINELPDATPAVAPTISVNSTNGLITATAGTKTSTHQLAFQAAKTITPTTTSQTAVPSGYYTGGAVTVAAIPSSYVIPSGTKTITENGTYDVKNYASATVNIESSGGDTSAEDGLITRSLTSYENNRVTTIGSSAFFSCSRLTTVSFPACTTIGSYAFANCSRLTTVSFPACTTIGGSAFFGCTSLTTVSFPACITIGGTAFYACSSLTTANFPKCTSIGSTAFRQCYSLTDVSFPACTTIGNSAFIHCSSLTDVSFPACTTIGSSAFDCCSRLTTVSFPACTTIGSTAFRQCYSLTDVSFPACTTIGNSVFFACSSLTAIYLMASSVCTLGNSNAFSSTGIWNTKGSIYVPTSLVASYKAASQWSYFKNRIFGV